MSNYKPLYGRRHMSLKEFVEAGEYVEEFRRHLYVSFIGTYVGISKNGNYFKISEDSDGDILISSFGNIEIPIEYNSEELEYYSLFYDFMKRIVGNYILSGDASDEFSILPKDFIDLDNKSITFHSDFDNDNILKLQFVEDKIIISLSGKNPDLSNDGVKVRIRSGISDYGNYGKELVKLYRDLMALDPYKKEAGKNRKKVRG